MNPPIVAPLSPADRREQDRLDPGRPRFIDVAHHVPAISGVRIGLALGTMPRLIVMAELDQDVIRMKILRLFPPTLSHETAGTATASRKVGARHPFGQTPREAATPPCVV